MFLELILFVVILRLNFEMVVVLTAKSK